MITRDDIINKLKYALEPLPFVYALWLEGADTNGTLDEYSDIDIWIDVEDSNIDKVLDAVESALLRLGRIDYKYVMPQGHPKLGQTVYHLEESSEYLMIDMNWQLHSRDDYTFIRGDKIETARVIFDKDNIIRYKDYDLQDNAESNTRRLEEARYRYTQHCRVLKYVYRRMYPEAYAYYNRYVVEPLIDLLRLIYTPAHSDYYLIHISHHIPEVERQKLESFLRISSFEDIEKKTAEAQVWFDELLEQVIEVKNETV